MCRVIFCVVGRGCLLWSVYSLGKTLSAFALLYSVPQRPNLDTQTPGFSCLPTFAFQSLMMKRASFFGVSSRRSNRSLFLQVLIEPFSFSFFDISGWGIDLDYCDAEWFALETSQDNSVFFWDCTQILHFGLFCWLWGYFISSKGFLPTVVDTMVI